MGYNKVIKYGRFIEVYEYEKDIQNCREKGRRLKVKAGRPSFSPSGADIEDKRGRREDNARRAGLAFARLVEANMAEPPSPVLITITYAENITDIGLARRDFNAFARAVRAVCGSAVRYICVPEFQQRGAIHFHALFWGLPDSLVARERDFRFFAGIWGKGFVDMIFTDGSVKIAWYLTKYMRKNFVDTRLLFKKAYLCSRNVLRPSVDKRPLMLFYKMGDLSTAELLTEKFFDTQWMGKGRFSRYRLT